MTIIGQCHIQNCVTLEQIKNRVLQNIYLFHLLTVSKLVFIPKEREQPQTENLDKYFLIKSSMVYS